MWRDQHHSIVQVAAKDIFMTSGNPQHRRQTNWYLLRRSNWMKRARDEARKRDAFIAGGDVGLASQMAQRVTEHVRLARLNNHLAIRAGAQNPHRRVLTGGRLEVW
jgi:hypothetical protein